MEFFKATVDLRDIDEGDKLPEARLKAIMKDMIGKTISTAPGSIELKGVVTEAHIVNGSIIVTAKVTRDSEKN